ncbi:hypothetical protein, partial [Epilithonimonas tenax]|uniref:hypothetical protein n=1 Tax=Epilithonimonas tenax TaxID=191577 RepID=UPI001E44995C
KLRRSDPLIAESFVIESKLRRSGLLILNIELLAARLERSSFCEEERRAKKRERKAEKLP